MAIKFVKDHTVQSLPPESFTAGQVVTDRNEASEMHFVRRGVAGFWDAKAKKLTDMDGRDISDLFEEAAEPEHIGAKSKVKTAAPAETPAQ